MFKCPSNILLLGSTYSGKSCFIIDLILNADKFFSETFTKVVYCYDIYQPLFEKIQHIAELHQGIYKDFDSHDGHMLLIIDDLYPPSSKEDLTLFESLFTKISHHHKITVLLIAHNIFLKTIRNLSLNSHYLVLFKQIRDKSQITHLASQICPKRTSFFTEAYASATELPFSHFVVSLRQETPELLRYFSDIFSEFPPYYIPKSINISKPCEVLNHAKTAEPSASILKKHLSTRAKRPWNFFKTFTEASSSPPLWNLS